MNTTNRTNWAEQALAKLSVQTQADCRAILETLRTDKAAGAEHFSRLDKERAWKMWEALAVKDIVLALYGAYLGAKTVEPEGAGL